MEEHGKWGSTVQGKGLDSRPHTCARVGHLQKTLGCVQLEKFPAPPFIHPRPGALRAWAPLDTAGWGNAHWVLTGRLVGPGPWVVAPLTSVPRSVRRALQAVRAAGKCDAVFKGFSDCLLKLG